MNKVLSLGLGIISIIGAYVFLVLYSISHVSDIGETLQTTSIGYIGLYQTVAIVLFIVAILSFILFVICKKFVVKKQLVILLVVAIMIGAGGFVGYTAYNAMTNYNDSYYGLDHDEDYKEISKTKEFKPYLPYYEYIEKNSGTTPYYSYSSYNTVDGDYIYTKLMDVSLESATTDEPASEIYVEYLKSSKKSITNKFALDKSYILKRLDDKEKVKSGSFEKLEYEYCISNDGCVFFMPFNGGLILVNVVAFDMTESELIDFAISQYEIMSK